MSTTSTSILPMQDGPRQLLRMAYENDKHHALFNNAMLRHAMRLLLDIQRYPSLASEADRAEALHHWLGHQTMPTHFLGFAASLLRQVQLQSNERVRAAEESEMPHVSDYDGFVLRACAETLADVLWPDRAEADQDQSTEGPVFPNCLERFTNERLQTVWFRLLQNYVGTILQHYFEASRIRQQNPKLPQELEKNLRNQDAARIALLALQGFSPTPDVETDMTLVLNKLAQVISDAVGHKK